MQSIVAEAKRNRFATVPKLGDEGMFVDFLGMTLGLTFFGFFSPHFISF